MLRKRGKKHSIKNGSNQRNQLSEQQNKKILVMIVNYVFM